MCTDSQAHLQNAEELKPYAIEELQARIDNAERESVAGLGIESDAMFRELEEEFFWDVRREPETLANQVK